MANHEPANQSMFSGEVSITGGTFSYSGEGGVINYFNSLKHSQAFETLKGRVVTGALHNSGEVSDPPKCHPGTRVAILEALVQWALLPEYPFPVKWLHSPAGAGKSAIMRTLAEMLIERGLLIASFFLSRTSADRNNSRSLISTIAYQLCLAIPATRVHIEGAIDKNPLIFQLSLSTQAQALIADPLIAVQRKLTQDGASFGSLPRVIILDGLDECEGHDSQCETLQVLCDCIRKLPVPLAVIVASRPEHHIRAVFDLGQLNQSSSRIALDDSFEPDADIEKFFLDNFTVIKQTHPFKQYLPSPWPPADIVNILVQKASGQFIYASTVVKFISLIRYNPADRLAIILGALDPGTLKPFEQLDLLYTTIFLMIDQEESPFVLRVLGALMTPPTTMRSNRSILSPAFLESLLGLKSGEIRRLLFDLESLLSITDDLVDIRIFHASLPDFLFDKSRSKEFFIDKGMVYEDLARRCLRLFTWTSEYDHYLECYLVDHTRTYFEKATPTIELHDAIANIDLARIAKLSVQSGQRQIIYGLRRLVPALLRAVQHSKFTDANILFSNHLQSYQRVLKSKLAPYLGGNWHTIYLILAATHLKNLPSRNLADFLEMAGLGLSETQRRVDDNGLQILQDYNTKGDLSITTFVSLLGSWVIPNLSSHYANFAIHLMKCISLGSGFYVRSEGILGSDISLSFGLYVFDILPGIMKNSPVRENLNSLVEDLQATLHYRQAYCGLDHALKDYISRTTVTIDVAKNQQPREDLRTSRSEHRKAVVANPSHATVHSPAKRKTKALRSFANTYSPSGQQQKSSLSESAPRRDFMIPPRTSFDVLKTPPEILPPMPEILASSTSPHSKGPPGTFTMPRRNPHPPFRRRPPSRKEPTSLPDNEGASSIDMDALPEILSDSEDSQTDRPTNFAVREANPVLIPAFRQRQGGYPHIYFHSKVNSGLNETAMEVTLDNMSNHILPVPVPTSSSSSALNAVDATEPVSEVVLSSNASWVEVGLGDGLDEVPQTPTSRRQRAFMKVDRFLERVKSGKGKKQRKRNGNEVPFEPLMQVPMHGQ